MRTVVVCGSTRFKPKIRKFAEDLKKLGVVVFEPHLHHSNEGQWEKLSTDYQKFVAMGLTYDHFEKIRMADVVFIYNEDGYVGNSVTLEMGYAAACAKPIYALCRDEVEKCRDCLFRDVVKTPEELVEKLR